MSNILRKNVLPVAVLCTAMFLAGAGPAAAARRSPPCWRPDQNFCASSG